jgi:hypothetical protein
MFLGGGNLIYTLPQIALMAALAAEESTVDGVAGSSCWGLYHVYVAIFRRLDMPVLGCCAQVTS